MEAQSERSPYAPMESHPILTSAVRTNTLEPTEITPMNYREPLPEGCPPDDAEEITAPRVVYRLVRNDPPTSYDFRSQRAESPRRVFRRVSECQA